MAEGLITFLSFGIPFVAVAVVALAIVVYAGVTVANPTLLVYPYLCVLFWVSSTTYGRLDFATHSVYGRGSGVLYFSLILWLLLAALLWAKTSAMLARCRSHPTNLYPWFIAWAVLLLAHVGYATLTGVDLREVLSPGGFSNVMWMGVLIALVLTAFRTEQQVERLTLFVVLTACASAVFGLGRWLLVGGDPANAYANLHGLNLKLTYFDINDSLLCCIGFVIATLRFYTPAPLQSKVWRAVYAFTALATLACIVLSFRRTAWIGLILAVGVLVWRLPAGRRLSFVLMMIGGTIPAVAYAAVTRLSQTRTAGGLSYFFYDLAPTAFGAEGSRLLELKLALSDFLQHPLFGIGAWGHYSGSQLISWQMQEGGGFVHSGLLHIALKSGLVGMILFGGLVVAFAVFTARAVKKMSTGPAALGVAGLAGVVFMIPDILIGTPIPQVRTMQMIAFCLSLPYLAYGVSRLNADPMRNRAIGLTFGRPTPATA